MRHRDLLTLSTGLAIVLLFVVDFQLPSVAEQFGFPNTIGSAIIGGLLMSPILHSMLTPLNNRLRRWRKERGRDIEEEERYETEDGMIRLIPNDIDAPAQNDQPRITRDGRFHS